jgi:excisionase family DNA binding protein
MKEQLAYTVEQFIGATKVGRTKAYEEIASGRLATYKVGRRRYISARAIAEWQKKLEHEAIADKSFWECA